MTNFKVVSARQLLLLGRTSDLPEVLVICDGSVSIPDQSIIDEFARSRDDAWLPGFTSADEPDLFRFAEPLQIYRLLPDPHLSGAISWRFDARLTLLRTRLWNV